MERHTNISSGPQARPSVKVRLADPARNGLPWAKPYTWRPGEAERQAEVAARLAGIRAQITASRRRRGRVRN